MELGIERLAANPQWSQSWGRCALVCNQASLNHDFYPSWQLCRDILGERLLAFFGPQHGFHATLQDNMIESEHAKGPFNLPVYSLYSETREPTEEMMSGIDTILVDLQIVGCRVYTFKYTVAACLRAAKKFGKKLVVLDRPNPLGGQVAEGRVLDLEVRSFVGEFSIPLRHGLTIGEAAQLFNKNIGAELEVIPMKDWSADMYWPDTGLPWTLTSPNLPTFDSVAIYPATVLFEGMNASEGRGTTLPFQFIGAPYLGDGEKFVKRVREIFDPKGVYLRPAAFQPTSGKWAGVTCAGLQIHITDASAIETFKLGLALARATIDLGADHFQWKQPPYEYEFHKLPINLILGMPDADQLLLADQFSVNDSYWYQGLDGYCERVREFLIYKRDLKPLGI
ncbi:MAG: exo-beta-N-acetylmuramidase NamZ domain-containing protein [Oligoflexus sp.]